jgi:phosphopantetheine--protein transferase-like protein
MIGCDLVKLSRIRGAIERGGIKVIQRFTQNPNIPLNFVGNINRVAGMWATKEAAFKALSAKGISWSQIRIDYPIDRPEIKLLGVGNCPVAVSISHDGEYAIAVALVK